MMEKVKRIAKRTMPLCFMPDGRLVCYRKGYIVEMVDGKEVRSISIPISLKEKIWGCSKLATRFFRLGIRAVEVLDNEHIILSRGNNLYELDLSKGIMSDGWFCGEGVRPLQFTKVEGVDGFTDGIYFGGYLGNMEKKPVHVYRRIGVDQWVKVYTFPQGTINHVHNIVADAFRKCLWIFTGDFDESAAIWKISRM